MFPEASLSHARTGCNAGLNGLPCFGVNETEGLLKRFSFSPSFWQR